MKTISPDKNRVAERGVFAAPWFLSSAIGLVALPGTILGARGSPRSGLKSIKKMVFFSVFLKAFWEGKNMKKLRKTL